MYRTWWPRMESPMCWMPATPAPSQTLSARATLCASQSTTTTVRNCFRGWTKQMNSLVRYGKNATKVKVNEEKQWKVWYALHCLHKEMEYNNTTYSNIVLTCSFGDNSSTYNTSVLMTPCILPGNVTLPSAETPESLLKMCTHTCLFPSPHRQS